MQMEEMKNLMPATTFTVVLERNANAVALCIVIYYNSMEEALSKARDSSCTSLSSNFDQDD